MRALRLTAPAPAPWIEAAALIPSTLRDLEAVEPMVASPQFQARFREDPDAAMTDAGLRPSAVLLAALRERVGVPGD